MVKILEATNFEGLAGRSGGCAPAGASLTLRDELETNERHYHEERNHQGKDNLILFPVAADRIGGNAGKIQTREHLGGLLKFYHRAAA